MGKTYKVYKYTFPNGMIYIGCTSLSLEQRRDDGYSHNKELKNAMSLFGWRTIEKTIIADGLSQKEAFALEKKTIADENATDPNIGYNISLGGKSTFAGLRHTKEHRKHMSELYKGRVFSEQTLERMKQSHEKERVPVIGVDENGKETRYESLLEAAKAIGSYSTNICRACKGNKKHKNILWRYADER